MKGYSTRQVAELLQVSEQRIRAFARAGFLNPDRGAGSAYRYSFQDIVLLRAARALEDAKVPARKIYKALRSLRSQLPDDRSLAAVRIVAVGDAVVVRESRASWEPASGQAILDFDVAAFATEAAPMVRHAALQAREESDHDADAWFRTAIDLEVVGEIEPARDAYQRVLSLDWEHVGARINLGRLYHDAGQLHDAERLYREALVKDKNDVLGWFNLGVALDDQARAEDAQKAYEQALAIDPDFADAHFNISRLCERTGQLAKALKHLMRYKALRNQKAAEV